MENWRSKCYTIEGTRKRLCVRESRGQNCIFNSLKIISILYIVCLPAYVSRIADFWVGHQEISFSFQQGVQLTLGFVQLKWQFSISNLEIVRLGFLFQLKMEPMIQMKKTLGKTLFQGFH